MSNPKPPGEQPDIDSLRQALPPRRVDDEPRMSLEGMNQPPDYGEEEVRTRPAPYRQEQYADESYNGPDEEDEEQEDLDEDMEEDDEDQEQTWEDDEDDNYPVPPSIRQSGGRILHDEPLYPGGPYLSEVNSWKKQFEEEGHTLNLSEDIAGEQFVWRTLARNEYREIMALPNTDPLQREEIICEACVLFPYEYDFQAMSSRKAGVPSALAEQILGESGFRKPSPPQRL